MSEYGCLDEAWETLSALLEDSGIPKSVRGKIKHAFDSLNDKSKEVKVRVNQALQDLDEVAEDPNTPSIARTQVWSIVSGLESKA